MGRDFPDVSIGRMLVPCGSGPFWCRTDRWVDRVTPGAQVEQWFADGSGEPRPKAGAVPRMYRPLLRRNADLGCIPRWHLADQQVNPPEEAARPQPGRSIGQAFSATTETETAASTPGMSFTSTL
jgi:hypothetical protein